MKITVKTKVPPGKNLRAVDLLAIKSGLSKTKVKQAMIKGAAWLQKAGRRPMRRIRRATLTLHPRDMAALYYDEAILSRSVPGAVLVLDSGNYSIWDKPAGMLSQGTLFGDHCSLIRYIESCGLSGRKIFPVHRIDREASGLILVAHEKKSAALFSAAFAQNRIEKTYRVSVTGNVAIEIGFSGTIDLPLDGKPARTGFQVLDYDKHLDRSLIQVNLQTGRRHQIRRHFDLIGHPVVGDPRYGKGNKDSGMRLRAVGLKFICPFKGKQIDLEQIPIPNYPPWESSKTVKQPS